MLLELLDELEVLASPELLELDSALLDELEPSPELLELPEELELDELRGTKSGGGTLMSRLLAS